MEKTITIQLQAKLFHIEPKTYEKLNGYINSLEKHFDCDPDKTEIIFDIKTRLTELFESENNLITMEMVDKAIEVLGSVQEFETVDSCDAKTIKRKLYRDIDNKKIAGVCSGLARYFGIDPVIIRILFILFFFVSGFSILAYAILWIVMKPAKTTTQKLEMDGELPTINSITNFFRK